MVVSGTCYCLVFIITFAILLDEEQSWGEDVGTIVVLWICSVVSVIFFILLGILVIFHCYLICKKTTSFDFFTKGSRNRVTDHRSIIDKTIESIEPQAIQDNKIDKK